MYVNIEKERCRYCCTRSLLKIMIILVLRFLGSYQNGLGLIEGRFRADPYSI